MIEILRRLIRIYTPFICSIVAIINGVIYLKGIDLPNFDYIMSETTGHSFLLVLYMLSTSKGMCIWYKLNLLCLLLIHVDGTIYYFSDMEFNSYCYGIIIISIIGLLFFLLYRITVGITKFLC